MKKLMQTMTALLAATLLLSACGSSLPNAQAIGSLDGKPLMVPYFEQIFKTAEESSANQSTVENTEEVSTDVDAEEVIFSVDSAVLVTTMSEVLKLSGNGDTDTRKLNQAISNFKVQHGDKYLEEAAKTYQLPIETQDDLVRILKFSLMYSAYLEGKTTVTDAQISEEFYKTEAKKYCASHILIENEADADKLQAALNDGTITFEELEEEARVIMQKTAEENGQTYSPDAQISVNDNTIGGVGVQQFADLGCQASGNYVAGFKEGLEAMAANSITAKPLKSEFGYHIVKVGDIEIQELTKEVQDKVRTTLISQQQNVSGFQGHHLLQIIRPYTIEMENEEAKASWDKYVEQLEEDAENFVSDESTNNVEETSGTATDETTSAAE